MTNEIEEDQPLNLYVERKTKIIWDARFFDGFVIVRPISPEMARHIRKIKSSLFVVDFDEFMGDYDTIRDWMEGNEPELKIGKE